MLLQVFGGGQELDGGFDAFALVGEEERLETLTPQEGNGSKGSDLDVFYVSSYGCRAELLSPITCGLFLTKNSGHSLFLLL